MDEARILEIFTQITKGKRDYITIDELCQYYPIGVGAKRAKYYVNHGNPRLEISGRTKRKPFFCLDKVREAIKWNAAKEKYGK